MDLSADIGQGFGVWNLTDDEGLLDAITSATVACGAHAGDATTMRRLCVAAAAGGATIGAQVGYRDLAGLGRRPIEYELGELRDEVLYQVAALDGFARVSGARVKYVRPYGALHDAAVASERIATALVAAVVDYDLTLTVPALPGSMLARVAERAGLRTVREGYPERGYLPDGRLAEVSAPGGVIRDPAEIVKRAVHLAAYGEVIAVDGTLLGVAVDTLYLPSQVSGAAALGHAVRTGLATAGVVVAPFAR